MKILCETTGSFQLLDPTTQILIVHDRPSVSENTAFVSGRAALGQVRVLANVTDEATDAEFEKYVKESSGDIELAISSFLSSYEIQNTTSKQRSTKSDAIPEKAKPGRKPKADEPELDLKE